MSSQFSSLSADAKKRAEREVCLQMKREMKLDVIQADVSFCSGRRGEDHGVPLAIATKCSIGAGRLCS